MPQNLITSIIDKKDSGTNSVFIGIAGSRTITYFLII